MNDIVFQVSYAALWVVTIVLSGAVLLLYRVHGTMLSSSTKAHQAQGPADGVRLNAIAAHDVHGRAVSIGRAAGDLQMIFFAATQCAACETALPALSEFAEAHRLDLATVVICGGQTEEEIASYASRLPSLVTVVPDKPWNVGAKWRVTSTPFALLVDAGGQVRARGGPATRDMFEQMLAHSLAEPTPARPVALAS